VVTISGKYFYNVHSLLLRMNVPSTDTDYFFQEDVYFIDEETLIITMPSALELNFHNGRDVFFYLSLNDGIDWSNGLQYTFLDMPHMTKLSLSIANLKGNIEISIYGINYRSDITNCFFGDQATPATFVSSTEIKCTIPPAESSQTTQLKLLIDDNFLIDGSKIFFYYEDANQILSIEPSQGHITGDVYAIISGSFPEFYDQVYQLYFGTQ